LYSNDDYVLELLQESGMITPDDGAAVTGTPSAIKKLIEGGKITEDDVARAVAVSASMDFVDLDEISIDPTILETVSAEVALRYRVAPVMHDGERLFIAISDPFDMEALDSLPYVLNIEFETVHAAVSKIDALLKEHYGLKGDEEVVLTPAPGAGSGDGEGGVHQLDDGSTGEPGGGDAPIIRLVSQILMEAMKNKASDIHLEPLEKSLRVRYRTPLKITRGDSQRHAGLLVLSYRPEKSLQMG